MFLFSSQKGCGGGGGGGELKAGQMKHKQRLGLSVGACICVVHVAMELRGCVEEKKKQKSSSEAALLVRV